MRSHETLTSFKRLQCQLLHWLYLFFLHLLYFASENLGDPKGQQWLFRCKDFGGLWLDSRIGRPTCSGAAVLSIQFALILTTIPPPTLR